MARARRDLHSFPTRRSSDLAGGKQRVFLAQDVADLVELDPADLLDPAAQDRIGDRPVGEAPLDRQVYVSVEHEPPVADQHLATDRKSTRLNSSHRCISYAVF